MPFPTWHRAYLVRLEDALRSIEGCGEVTLPFWDETSQSSLSNGVPWALTVETFELDGKTIAIPLRSFVFNKTINDHISGDNLNYSEPAATRLSVIRYRDWWARRRTEPKPKPTTTSIPTTTEMSRF